MDDWLVWTYNQVMQTLFFQPPKLRSESKSRITIFLHGFPAIRSRQNRAIAEVVVQETQTPGWLALYDGLGQAPGIFRFSENLRQVRDGVRELAEKFASFDLVGHSWGGFMALALANEWKEKIRRMVLMSPLLHFPGSAEQVRSWFGDVARDNPQIQLGDVDELARDFISVGKQNESAQLIRGLSPQTETLFLQAHEDALTPPVAAQAMLPAFTSRVKFELVETDHSFLIGRDEITQRIAIFLRD